MEKRGERVFCQGLKRVEEKRCLSVPMFVQGLPNSRWNFDLFRFVCSILSKWKSTDVPYANCYTKLSAHEGPTFLWKVIRTHSSWLASKQSWTFLGLSAVLKLFISLFEFMTLECKSQVQERQIRVDINKESKMFAHTASWKSKIYRTKLRRLLKILIRTFRTVR